MTILHECLCHPTYVSRELLHKSMHKKFIYVCSDWFNGHAKTCDHCDGPPLEINGAVTVVTGECAMLKLVRL